MPTTEEDLVLKFIGYFRDSWPEDLDEPLSMMAEEGYFQLGDRSIPPWHGRAKIKSELERMKAYCPDQGHEMINVVASGRFVVTERVDRWKIKDIWGRSPLIGIFEVVDGKIVAWREYSDGSSSGPAQTGISREAWHKMIA